MFIECREERLPTHLAEDINETGLLKSKVTTPLNTPYPAIKFQGRNYSVRKGDWAEVTSNGLMVFSAGRIIQNEQHDYDSEFHRYSRFTDMVQWINGINARYFPESDICIVEHKHGYATLTLNSKQLTVGQGDVIKLDKGTLYVMSHTSYRCQFTNQGIKCVLGERHNNEKVSVLIAHFNEGKRLGDQIKVTFEDCRISLTKKRTTFVMNPSGMLVITEGKIIHCRSLPC